MEPIGMVLIPAGEFQMGSEEGNFDEKPIHKVSIDAFYIDQYEVTVAEYQIFIKETKYQSPNWKKLEKFAPTDKHPMIFVSWQDAMEYAKWVGKRLPTEAEWEYVARSGLISSSESAMSVESLSKNSFGIAGLLGNVWEWCLDIYDPKFYLNSDNPHNPRSFGTSKADTKYAVIRGGSWYQSNNQLRSANRNFANAGVSLAHLGFRCARPVSKITTWNTKRKK